MISVTQAESRIQEYLTQPQACVRPLADTLGYCLSEDIIAERDYPPFDRITHDGVALEFESYRAGVRTFPIFGYAAAGNPRARLNDSSHCIEVATGAPLPEGCDTIVPYELFTKGNTSAILMEGIDKGDCLHFQGSDKKAGEKLLSRHCKIGMHEIAILAGNGNADVPVYAKPSIGILATGNELVGTDEPVAPHQIRRSNDAALRAALIANGFPIVSVLAAKDNKAHIYGAISALLAKNSVVLITGGVSRGTFDYVSEVLKALEVKEIFHRVAQRPGKPLWFGISKEYKLVFGLPGNPASCLTCLIRYVLPALAHMSGSATARSHPATLAHSVTAHAGLTRFLPAHIAHETNIASAAATQGSGDFIGLQGTDGLIELPAGEKDFFQSQIITFFPWGVA